MICLSLVVFFVNLEPNLRRLAIFQTEMRASDQDPRTGWPGQRLPRHFFKDGRWIGVMPKNPVVDLNTGEISGASATG
jgi:peptide/nickel transport system permease protein